MLSFRKLLFGRASKRNAVAFICDKSLIPAAAFMGKRLTALNPRLDTDIVLLSDARDEFERVSALVPKLRIKEIDFDDGDYRGREVPLRFKACYLRMSLPRLIPEYDRIIYLDLDMYVRSQTMFDLFDIDMQGKIIAAVRAVNMLFEFRLLNSGFQLIDTAAYRAGGIEEECFSLVRSLEQLHPARDQFITNQIFRTGGRDWLELSPFFNLTSKYMKTELALAFPPEVIHFIGPVKQWATPSFADHHPARTELADFLTATEWAGFIGSKKAPSRQLNTARLNRLAELGDSLNNFLMFLRTTQFADVAQGVTSPQLQHLPAYKDQ